MSDQFKLPNKKAVVFWPIGTGDSTTLVLKPGEIVMQIDLHHMEKADDESEPEWNIVDHLVQALPKRNGKPYLSVFVLTHPDKDHIQGFGELLSKVHIGELWHTPKIFRDHANQEDMCEDAQAFRKEADRRRRAIIASPKTIKSGDRLRVIGHDDILHDEKYKNLPESFKSRPGDLLHTIDGTDLQNELHVFIHAPFKDDQAKDKNNTSLSLNVAIFDGVKYGQFFFFGDREYPTIKRIFEQTEKSATHANDGNTPYLYWDVMLCAHHCSKAVMYWQEENDTEPVFKRDIMDYLERYSRNNTGYIVASAHSKFTGGTGDNPPHKKARTQYEKIVNAGRFICTHEYPNKEAPAPLVFTIGAAGLEFDDKRIKSNGPSALAASIFAAQGGHCPPSHQVGFGKHLL
jgi:hypothetical protein